MCRRLMDALSREQGTAAVLHSPGPTSPGGIMDARHKAGLQSAAGGMEKSGRVGTGVPNTRSMLECASALRPAVEGLETVGVAGDGCSKDERVALSYSDGEAGSMLSPSLGDGGWGR